MMQNNKILFGITGASGAGKSYVSDIFRQNGFYIIDADKTGHNIIKKGRRAYYDIISEFGDIILMSDGEIDRRKLGSIVFSDKKRLDVLNKITHPQIRNEIYAEADKHDICGVDGALLFECGIKCSPVISVIADKDIRIKRIMKRDGISAEDAENRINSQKNNDFYIANSDFVIINNGGDINILKIEE